MKDKLKELYDKWQALTKQNKIKYGAVAGIVLVIIIFSFWGGGDSTPSEEQVAYEQNQTKKNNEVKLNVSSEKVNDLVEKSFANQLEVYEKANQQENEALRDNITKLMQVIVELRNQQEQIENNVTNISLSQQFSSQQSSINSSVARPHNYQWKGGVIEVSAPKNLTSVTGGNNTTKTNLLTASTMQKVIMLNGMYAPTFAKGQANPYPVFFRLQDFSNMPNEVSRQLSGCRVLGSGYGEASDERVHIRLKHINCVAKNGKIVISKDVDGVVFGEDGIIGVAGELRANFNKILTSTFFLYGLKGVGDALQNATRQPVIIQSSNGNSQTVNQQSQKSEDIARSAIGNGMSEGFKMMADFYLKYLNEMSPVIYVRGGREVELAFTNDVELTLQDVNLEAWRDDDNTDGALIDNLKAVESKSELE